MPNSRATARSEMAPPLAVTLFGLGLLLLGVAGVLLIVLTWSRARFLLRVASVLVGMGLLLYIPQFFAPGTVRIVHGVLLGVGCVLFGLALVRIEHAQLRGVGSRRPQPVTV